jgi:hypothetical protein
MVERDVVIPSEVVEATIEYFTKLDKSGDKRAMNKMAQRLGKEQPGLLQFAIGYREQHGDDVGEAAMFYSTLVWAIFDRMYPRHLQRVTPDNIEAAKEIVSQALAEVEGLADKPEHERYAQSQADLQPHVYAKLSELLDEDVRKEAMTAECASIIFEPTQVIVETFDAAMNGRRPGERVGPIVRDTPKVGRNEPCPCGSGKKYKKCHGQAA